VIPDNSAEMKIVYLITGSGGSFYCGNCYRDMIFVRAIRKVPGIKASAIPLYLPPDNSTVASGLDKNVFFGAISMYVREKIPFFRNMPAFMDKILDSSSMLRMAARQAGTTNTAGLEEMTLHMIEGDNAFRKHEVDRLVKYLEKDGKPDIIHLSNALILGLARQLKKRMKVKVVCSLLNEDDWIEEMAEPYRSKAWEMIGIESQHVDSFVTPSVYYRDLFIKKTGIAGSNISVVPLGYEPEETASATRISDFPVIGFFSRINHMNGFDKIADAFISMKSDGYPGLSLHVCGGYTGSDRHFVSEQMKKIRDHGFERSVRIYEGFEGDMKLEFFNNVDLISVPVRKYDGYGLYLLEANAAGIPVVQPATGAFPEIIEATGGGTTYSPDSIDELIKSLSLLLDNHSLREYLGKKGMEGVKSKLSLGKMSERLSDVYDIS
jgi:glycosyltransferase involved in cell wall biosynthesis